MKAAVIGSSISYSKSPIIHKYWLAQENISGSYEIIDVAPDDFSSSIQKIIEEGYDGFNVTVPYKQKIMSFCESIDETAQKIGAVNTVLIKNKKLYGTNTDAFGFVENIKSSVPNFSFKNKIAFVLGAGGAARAVVYGLIERGIQKIKICNRTFSKAEALKQMAPDIIEIVKWDERAEALQGTDLLVNTTSLGMEGRPDLALDLSLLPTEALVNDIVYSPLMTPLLQVAAARGNDIVTGIGMLLHQARPAFEAWTGILPEVSEALKQKILK